MTGHRISLVTAALSTARLSTAALGAALLLSACAGPDASGPTTPGFAALDRDATAADKLTDGFEYEPYVNASTARLLVTRAGTKYFGAANDDGTEVCVVIIPPAGMPQAFAGCSTVSNANAAMEFSGADHSKKTTFVTDGYDTRELESEGWTKIHDNILVAGQ